MLSLHCRCCAPALCWTLHILRHSRCLGHYLDLVLRVQALQICGQGVTWLLAIHFFTSMSHPISTAGCSKVFLITSTSHFYITKKQTWPLQLTVLVNITLDLNSSPPSYSSLEHCFSLSLVCETGKLFQAHD